MKRVHLLPENIWDEQDIVMPNWSKKISNDLVALLRIFFRKTAYKSEFSEFFLPLGQPLVDALHETCAPTSKKYMGSTRYSDEKLVKKISNDLIALLRFRFRKTT